MARQTSNAQTLKAALSSLPREAGSTAAYLFVGSEDYLIEVAVRRVVETLLGAEGADAAREVYHAKDKGCGPALDAACALPMFASRKVVLLRGVEHLSAAEHKDIVAYLDRPSAMTCLLLCGTHVPKTSQGAKALLAHTQLRTMHFEPLEERDLASWVATQAKKRDLPLDRDAVAWLVAAAGPSLRSLDHALERIDLYLPGERTRLRVEDISPHVQDERSRTIFELTDALLADDRVLALRCVRRLLDHGESAIGVVARIGSLTRQLLLLAEGEAARLTDAEVFGGSPPPSFVLRKMRAPARRMGRDRLRRSAHLVVRTDEKLKSSKLPDLILVDQLLLDWGR